MTEGGAQEKPEQDDDTGQERSVDLALPEKRVAEVLAAFESHVQRQQSILDGETAALLSPEPDGDVERSVVGDVSAESGPGDSSPTRRKIIRSGSVRLLKKGIRLMRRSRSSDGSRHTDDPPSSAVI